AAAIPPPCQIVVRSRAIRCQEPPRHSGGCRLRLNRRTKRAARRLQPCVRTREPNALPETWSKAQVAGERGPVQDRTPTALRELGAESGRSCELYYLLDELFARHHMAVKSGCYRLRHLIEFFECDPEIFLPQCWLQISRADAEGGVPHR